MRNSRLFSVAGLVTVLAASIIACSAPVDEPPPRNLLLITLDTLRADHLGLYGYQRPTSPNLDAFASRATVFEDVTCSMGTTLPSHVSIFTGLRPYQHGVRRNGQGPTRDLTSLFDLLGERGAKTGAVVGTRGLAERYLAGLGFDEVIFPGSREQFQVRAQLVTDQANGWLGRQGAEPFALWVNYYDTHEPYTPPGRFARAFRRGYEGRLPATLSVKRLLGFNELPAGRRLPPADVEHVTDLYDAEIAYLDFQVGRLLRAVEDRGLLDDTLIVIVGDHGQALGEGGYFGHGRRLLEGVVKVPLVIREPKRHIASRVQVPVETVDIFPTLLDLFDLPDPDEDRVTGRSLEPALAGRGLAEVPYRAIELAAFPNRPKEAGIALHGGDWKAIHYRDATGVETRSLTRAENGLDGINVWEDESTEAKWLAAAWTHLEPASSVVDVPLDEEQSRMLKALGYLD